MAEPSEAEQPLITTPAEMFQAISKSHVDANMPPEDKLHSILGRDLKAFAETEFPERDAGDPRYQILGMKQVGIGWPRLYMIVNFDNEQDPEQWGLLSAIAKDQERFEVEHFLTVAEAKAEPGAAQKLFPPEVFQWLNEAADRE
ncbi:MAG: hypothetical protein AAF270_15610 [Pseudomonadota bacterium]